MLPLEIFLEIFSQLNNLPSPVSIANCSLVCRSFRPICQRYIFNQISIFLPHKLNRVVQLAKLLNDNGALLSFITFVRVDMVFDGSPHLPEVDECFGSLVQFLRSSPLVELYVDAVWYASVLERPGEWTSIPPMLRAAVEELITSAPTLRTLTMNGMRYPHHVIPSLSTDVLEMFTFSGANPDEDEDPPPYTSEPEEVLVSNRQEARIPPVRILKLHISLYDALEVMNSTQPSGMPTVDGGFVKELQLSTDRARGYSSLPELLLRCPNLERLSIDLWTALNNIDTIFHGKTIPAFRTLSHLSIHLGGARRAERVLFHGLFDLLATFPLDNSLTSIILTSIMAPLSVDQEPQWSNHIMAEWRKPLSVLTPTAFPHLTKVFLEAGIIDRRPRDTEGKQLIQEMKDLSFESLKSRMDFTVNIGYTWEPGRRR